MEPVTASWVSWLANAPPAVQLFTIFCGALLTGLVVWRAPSVAEAVARVRGKGRTDREDELQREVDELTGKVHDLEETLRLMQHREEERRRLLEALLPRMQCLIPGCTHAEIAEILSAMLNDNLWAAA